MALNLKEEEEEENKSSVISPALHICQVGKSVSINTFALGHDGLQIGHLFNLLPPNFPSKMLIEQGFEIFLLRAGHMGQAYVLSIHIV